MGADLRGAGLLRHADHRPAAVGDPEASFLIRASTANTARYNRAHPLRRTTDRAPGAAIRQVEMGLMRRKGLMGSLRSPSLPVPLSSCPSYSLPAAWFDRNRTFSTHRAFFWFVGRDFERGQRVSRDVQINRLPSCIEAAVNQ